ncbi:MAG: glycosyltransferase family 2 protein [Acidobacteria bacterium]|nr:glycosyltransferase family 2 protein [Acidobacteriota bacterium]
MPTLSVVVPVHNGSRTIERCLRALVSSPDFETIVVNDGSTDNTSALIDRFPVRKLENLTAAGPARARNLGASVASGDILVFIDADVEVHADTLIRIAQVFADRPELHAIIGSYDDAPEERSTISLFKNLLHHYVHQHAWQRATTFWGGCGAVRRETFLQLGGMNELFPRPSVEDIEFGYRLYQSGLLCEMRREIQAKHLKKWTFRGLIETDLICRAIPWTELMFEMRMFPADLNFTHGHRISSFLVFAILGTLSLSLFLKSALAIGLLLMLGFVALNQDFYRFLAKRGGSKFLYTAVPFHFLYCGYSALGFGCGIASFWLRSISGRRRLFYSSLQQKIPTP